jgi:hypothetical protein
MSFQRNWSKRVTYVHEFINRFVFPTDLCSEERVVRVGIGRKLGMEGNMANKACFLLSPTLPNHLPCCILASHWDLALLLRFCTYSLYVCFGGIGVWTQSSHDL